MGANPVVWTYKIKYENNNNKTNLVLAVEDGVEGQLLLTGGARGTLLVVAPAAGWNLLGAEDRASTPESVVKKNC
jgi:hypothetical protein